MKTAIYPGSFDPITLGHLNIIKRAAVCFDKLIVCVMVNSEKVNRGLFTPEERVELIRRVVAKLPNVEADCSSTLIAEYPPEAGLHSGEGPAGGIRLRERAADGAHQPQAESPAGDHVPALQRKIHLCELQHGQRDGPLWGGAL